jgi:hypothetical protein
MTTTSAEPVVLPVIDVPTEPAARVPNLPRRPYRDLFLVSFVILFFELASIRWFGSTVVFLTFFTNVVLLACFLGMSVGLLSAGRKQNFIRWTLPLTLLSVALAMITFHVYERWGNYLTIGVGNQQASPSVIYFGTEYHPNDPSHLIIPLWSIAGFFFTLISIIFIGLGQRMGRAFDAIPNRVLAYTTDVLGSLTGIAAFGLMSYLQLSPQIWFFPIVILLLYLVGRWSYVQVLSAVATVFLIGMSAYGAGEPGQIFWSPYYKISYTPSNGSINTNNIAHQQMVDIGTDGPGYALPHLLNRDAGGKPFGDVMIIGAGSGNDVSAALRYGAKHIDAVEIDPMINQIGRWYHPDKPYADPRVSIHLTDGRAYVRKTKQKYDLAVYALVDSLVLHSGYSSLRLENFLFTKQAFQDVKKTLKPDGVFAVYNYFRQGWVVARIEEMAEDVFGTKPLVISLPYQSTITPPDSQANIRTFILISPDPKRLDAIRHQFQLQKNFWVNLSPASNDHMNGYREISPAPGSIRWQKIGPATVETKSPQEQSKLTGDERAAYRAISDVPVDNWPQLYLREKKIPLEPTQTGMWTIGILSVLILLAFTWPIWFDGIRPKSVPNGQMFFLGAGFMLLESKGVVHMALLFGSTWVVNSVVFFAILVMILFANLYVLAVKPRKLWPYYGLLVVALLVNALVPMDYFLSLPLVWRTISSCAVVFVPIFFAGVIFATVFRESKRPDVDFGSNVAGIILGGLSEQLSLVIGFNYLLLIAVGYYLLSSVLGPRLRRASAGSVPATQTT